MTGILEKFYVEHNIHGAKVMARSLQLTIDCAEEGEIDFNHPDAQGRSRRLCERDEAPGRGQPAGRIVRGLAEGSLTPAGGRREERTWRVRLNPPTKRPDGLA